MRSRPRAEVRIPSRVYPGQRMIVTVALESAARTPIDFVRLDLVGEALTVGNNSNMLTHPRLHARAELLGQGHLEEGTRELRASFDLPADSPPSYRGTILELRYRLLLDVSIPWWPDLHEAYDLPVLPRPASRPRRAPAASTSLRQNEPFVELSLDDVAFAPGDVIGGSFAFGNLDRAQVRGVDLALVAFEQARAAYASGAPREALRYSARLPAETITGGREVPIRFRVPHAAAVSFGCAEAALGWAFEVRLDVKGGADVIHRVPVTLAAFDRPAEPGPMRRLVGAGRWTAVWADVGRRYGLVIGDGELELSGTIEGCGVIVRTAVRDGRGELTADLRWDSWEIGLVVAMRRFIDLPGIAVDDDAPFVRRFRVKGREPAQVRAALPAALRRALLAFDDVYLDDDHAVVRSASPGHDQPWIGDFVAKVAALASALQKAAQQLVPPAALASALPAWRAFTAAYGGRLAVGSMSLHGAVIEGARFDITTAFDGDRAHGTTLRLTVDPPLPREHEPTDAAAQAALPPSARAIIAALAKDGRAPHIEPDRIALDIAGPLADPAAERETMDALSALAAALRGDRSAGPYR
jgi:hypothetical protein